MHFNCTLENKKRTVKISLNQPAPSNGKPSLPPYPTNRMQSNHKENEHEKRNLHSPGHTAQERPGR